MVKIFDDGVLEAILYTDHWVFVRWIQNKRGKLQKALIKDLLDMEQFILNRRLKGWFTLSETNHKDFHKLLMKFGAKPGVTDGGFQYFIKPIIRDGDLHVR